nr:type II secretion system protein [Rhodoferax sp.]
MLKTRIERAAKAGQRGFSLVEIALVLVIMGLILGVIINALGPQLDNRNVNETQQRIKQASDAVLAFAMVNRRIPCPATLASNGLEVMTVLVATEQRGRCANPNDGYLPARTLGLGEQSVGGEMQDAWAFGLRYGVSHLTTSNSEPINANNPINCPAANPCYFLTMANGIKNNFYQGTAQVTPPPAGELRVCASSSGISATNCGAVAANTLVSASFVVWSMGRNGTLSSGVDEAANLNGDVVYVSHPRTEVGGTNGAFDDLFQWQTTETIVSNMLKAGVLP